MNFGDFFISVFGFAIFKTECDLCGCQEKYTKNGRNYTNNICNMNDSLRLTYVVHIAGVASC